MQTIERVLWLEVEGKELKDIDPVAYIRSRNEISSLERASVFLTSANLADYQISQALLGDRNISCICTVGLGNALRVGDLSHQTACRTINICLITDVSLTVNASLETLSLVTEAKTCAMVDAKIPSTVSGKPSTGTGTDCNLVVAGLSNPIHYAGKHTDFGHHVGRLVYDTVSKGINRWQSKYLTSRGSRGMV
ncbi:MAG: adenosylcobinamide amidohydrolase [Pseudobacteriovorax sp.]|nr:adenosylcobinamide amidohydrolase [Pseudobacteriovorax sp.]